MLEKFSTDVQYLKHAVLKEVAAMAFNGTLEAENVTTNFDFSKINMYIEKED